MVAISDPDYIWLQGDATGSTHRYFFGPLIAFGLAWFPERLPLVAVSDLDHIWLQPDANGSTQRYSFGPTGCMQMILLTFDSMQTQMA